MKQSESNGIGVRRWLAAGLLAAGIGAGSLVRAQVPQVLSIEAVPPIHAITTVGAEILILVNFNVPIEVIAGASGQLPYLELSFSPTIRQATYEYTVGNVMLLKYVVQPGDFIAPLRYPAGSPGFPSFALKDNSAVIKNAATPDRWYFFYGIPNVGEPGSLDQTSSVSVRTMSLSGAGTVAEGQSVGWTVGRGGIFASEITASITYAPEGLVSGPDTGSVTIQAGRDSTTLTLTGQLPGTATVSLRPVGYPADGSGDLIKTLEVTGVPRQLLLSGPQPINEGQSATWTVQRTGSTVGNLLVNLNSSNPNIFAVPSTVTIQNGVATANFVVQARNGTYSAILTATATGYIQGSESIQILNVAPTVQANAPSSGTVGDDLTFIFTAQDPGIFDVVTGTWYWGDGSPSTPSLPGQPVTHQFTRPGTFTVTLVVDDGDGGIVTMTFDVVIEAGYVLDVIIRQPGYLGLLGVGSGTVSFDPPPNAYGQFDRRISSVLVTAHPDQPNAQGFNSYVYSWTGEGLSDEGRAILGPQSVRVIMGQDREIALLFSREYRQGDLRGDVDGDGLTDEWELRYGLNPLSRAGIHGAGGSPSGDRLPNAPNTWDYPIPYSATWTGYAPTGPLFNNYLQFRGGLTDDIWDPAFPGTVDAEDVPGTDPTVVDTSGDGLTDGWLYYFWLQAIADTNFVGRAYDPNTITGTLAIANEDIRYYFNPRYNRGLAGMDLDGDGLTTLEEYHLGTDPINWDTDGDGMPDGWEIYYGLDPLVRDQNQNPDLDFMAYMELEEQIDGVTVTNVYRHLDVLTRNAVSNHHMGVRSGYDPRTAFVPTVRIGGLTSPLEPAPNTRPYTNYEEFYVMRWWMDQGAVASIGPNQWHLWSTDPLSPDTDRDGMPDGWELYVGLIPMDTPAGRADGAQDPDDDQLSNRAEFSCRRAAEYYSEAVMGSIVANSQARRPNRPVTLSTTHFQMMDPGWLNKRWPTDPFNWDTDGDMIPDYHESLVFRYDIPGITGRVVNNKCYAGGGLNPTSADTDGDFIPDYWESYYAGGPQGRMVIYPPEALDKWTHSFEGPATPPSPNEDGVRFGMDGTWPDAVGVQYDYDGDGLHNYQEYWVNALYHFRYDVWRGNAGYFDYQPTDFFYPPTEDFPDRMGRQPRGWDWAFFAEPMMRIPWHFMLPQYKESGLEDLLPLPLRYSSTDPRNWDTDGDQMDDYWELFHGLNPLFGSYDIVRGHRVISDFPLSRYFPEMPYGIGDQYADPDQDGLMNFEEALIPDRAAPPHSHTDPAPLWITDMSYGRSWVNKYYKIGGLPFYWANPSFMMVDPFGAPILADPYRPSYIFDFASNEGYDTDNDNLSDKQEMIGSNVPGQTDPLLHEAPRRRRALYLDGSAAARTRDAYFHGPDPLRSFSVEVWVRAQNPVSGVKQVIVDRPVMMPESDVMPNPDPVRRNFQIGITAEGHPYAMYDNAGNVLMTQSAVAQTHVMSVDAWTHLAATFDGVAKRLQLFVNGQVAASIPVTVIPAYGWVEGDPVTILPSPIVIGASDSNPAGIINGSPIYWNNFILPPPNPPFLGDFFQGWVDEVRIWDGARSADSIRRTMRMAFMQKDVLEIQANRNVFGQSVPDILYHYSFNTLPDPDHEGIVPQGFGVLNGRPPDWNMIPWWGTAPHRSMVYTDYRFVHWIQNTVAHVPLNPPLDSHLFNSNIHDFPNTANPYGYGYRHGRTVLEEYNPEVSWAFRAVIFDPVNHRLYNDLLPLMNAVADADVELWDGYGAGTNYDYDTDGDGLPDWWEIEHGLDPNSAEGDDGAWGDPDGDGLDNLAEYLAGLDPLSSNTRDDGYMDYFSRPDNQSLTYGEMYDDWDGMPSLWEVQHGLDPRRYDAHEDPDGDGWTNFAEFMAGSHPLNNASYPTPPVNFRIHYAGDQRSGPVRIQAYTVPTMDGEPDARFTVTGGRLIGVFDQPAGTTDGGVAFAGTVNNTPVFPASLTIRLPGITLNDNGAGTLVGADPGISGTIDYATGAWTISVEQPPGPNLAIVASYVYVDIQQTIYPLGASFLQATEGHLREGKNWFFAYIDLNNNNQWDPGEPAGLALYQPIPVSWGFLEVEIVLRDELTGYPRFQWQLPAGAEETLVKINFASMSGQPQVLQTRIRAPRNHLHEGDLLALGRHGLPHGNSTTPMYQWFAEVAQTVQSGYFWVEWNPTGTRTDPSLVSPVTGAALNRSMVELRWSADRRNAAFRIQIARNAPGGSLVFDRKVPNVPRYADMAGTHYFAYLPQWFDDAFLEIPDGQYYWRVRADNNNPVNPASPETGWDSPWTGWTPFVLNRNDVTKAPFSVLSSISGEVKYFGKVPSFEFMDLLVQPDGQRREFSSAIDGKRFFKTPAVPGTVVVERILPGVPGPLETFTDNGLGVLTGSAGGLGMVNYTTGAWSISIPSALPPPAGGEVIVASYDHKANPVVVQAYRNASFSGRPVGQQTLPGKGPYALHGVRDGLYSVRAFIDQNFNGVPDIWETHGFLKDSFNMGNDRDVSALRVGPSVFGQDFILRDRDTDNDKLPDAWEYHMFGNLDVSPSDQWTPGLTVLQEYADGVLDSSPLRWDTDFDGLPDVFENMLGSDSMNWDSDGTGISDLEQYFSGSNPSDPDDTRRFTIPAIRLNQNGEVELEWTVNRVPEGGQVTYVVLRRESLREGVWQPVAEITLTGPRHVHEHVWVDAVQKGRPVGHYRLLAKAQVAQ